MRLKDYYFDILKKLVDKRKASPMTLEFLAKSLDKSQSTLSNFEKGKLIDYNVLEDYANIFGYELNLLFELKS